MIGQIVAPNFTLLLHTLTSPSPVPEAADLPRVGGAEFGRRGAIICAVTSAAAAQRSGLGRHRGSRRARLPAKVDVTGFIYQPS